MKNGFVDAVTRQIQLFLVWWHLFKTSFPPLWAAAEQFAPLVLTRCPDCQKPKFWLWIPVGNHSQCDDLEDHREEHTDYQTDEPLPPFG